MSPRFLADADFNGRIVRGLLRREAAIDLERARKRLEGLPDPEVLAIAAREGRVLLSHDRRTMPRHFARFVEYHTSPGVLIVSQWLDIGEAVEELVMIWAASDAEEWENVLEYIPL